MALMTPRVCYTTSSNRSVSEQKRESDNRVEHLEKESLERGEQITDTALIPSTLSVPSVTPMGRTHEPYLALHFRDFRLLFIGSFFASIGEQMINVAIGWELYERTGSALVLGFVGLVQVLPIFLFSLPAGHLADRLNRKYIILCTQVLLMLASAGLTVLSLLQGPLPLIYLCLLFIGLASAFGNPASSALMPQTVPEYAYENAATWSSSSWQLASVLGPALGGFMIAFLHGAMSVYAFNAITSLVVLVLIALLRVQGQSGQARASTATTRQSLVEGFQFLRQARIIMAAITLDMFAVLLGGATTLLPIFAKNILDVGPTGLGWLRAAPSIGAICVSLCLTHISPFKKAGRVLLLAVVGFGAATIIFGFSRSFWLSLLMLFLLGGFDNISVVIRSTLLLTRTPDALRGRVSSVNALFIGASNELGGFESGLAAQLFGPVLAVVGGGVGTLLVVLCVALIWPEMRRLAALRP